MVRNFTDIRDSDGSRPTIIDVSHISSQPTLHKPSQQSSRGTFAEEVLSSVLDAAPSQWKSAELNDNAGIGRFAVLIYPLGICVFIENHRVAVSVHR